MYIGVSPTAFDKLVADGRMPQPRRIDGRKIWDTRCAGISASVVVRRSRYPERRNSFWRINPQWRQDAAGGDSDSERRNGRRSHNRLSAQPIFRFEP
jgi:hypothetical protein